jgi:hypothetical protein
MLAELTEKKRITAPYKAAGGGGLAPWTPFPSVPSGADGTPKTILFQPQICPAHGEHLSLLIEYCGRCGDPAYASGIRKKEAVYRANGLATLFLTPESFRGDWPSRTLEQIEAILVERLTSFRTVRGRAAPIRRGNSRPNAVHVP